MLNLLRVAICTINRDSNHSRGLMRDPGILSVQSFQDTDILYSKTETFSISPRFLLSTVLLVCPSGLVTCHLYCEAVWLSNTYRYNTSWVGKKALLPRPALWIGTWIKRLSYKVQRTSEHLVPLRVEQSQVQIQVQSNPHKLARRGELAIPGEQPKTTPQSWKENTMTQELPQESLERGVPAPITYTAP